MLAEFLLFDRMTSVHHASIYPRWNDQIQYLRESYTAFEEAKAHGLAAGLKFALGKPALQGTLHDTTALVVFWLTGAASRSAALSLNLLVFLAWQVSLLLVITRRSGSPALGWMAFGLVLGLAGPWIGEAGSAVDFRLDHAAMCLMGLVSTLALLTHGFRSTRWAAALGVATGILLLERFLTGVYFAAIFLASVVWILCGAERGRRLGNLGLAGLLAAAVALPVFWINRTAIYTYYWAISPARKARRVRPAWICGIRCSSSAGISGTCISGRGSAGPWPPLRSFCCWAYSWPGPSPPREQAWTATGFTLPWPTCSCLPRCCASTGRNPNMSSACWPRASSS